MTDHVTSGNYDMQFDAQQSHILQIVDKNGRTLGFTAGEARDLHALLSRHQLELFQRANGYPTLEEAQRQHLCPFCDPEDQKKPGQRYHDSLLDLDEDFSAYRCINGHTFFIDKKLEGATK